MHVDNREDWVELEHMRRKTKNVFKTESRLP